MAIAESGRLGEVRLFGTIGGELDAVDRLLKTLREPQRILHFVYEAGPCALTIIRYLTGRGQDCAVVSPSLTPKRSGDRVKTDRRDAVTLARLHRAGELRAIYVPDDGDEAMRDLVRGREDAVEVAREAKQRLKAFFVATRPAVSRHSGLDNSVPPLARGPAAGPSRTADHTAGVSHDHHRDRRRIVRVTNQLQQLVPTSRWAPVVEALQALRGVSFVTAAGLIAELGDLQRFTHPRGLMGYLGLVPSQHSTGTTRRRGTITKTGNAHARRLLAEAAWAYQIVPRIGRAMLKRQEHLPTAIRDLAWKAQLRLTARFRRLIARGKPRPVIATAIARELTGFVWALARAVPRP